MKFGPIDLKRGDKSRGAVSEPAKIEENKEASGDAKSKGSEITQEELLGELSEMNLGAEPKPGEDDGSARGNRMSQIKDNTIDKLSPLGRAGKSQLGVFKAEGKELKRLLGAKDLTIYKTDAIAIMVRKAGSLVEFLEGYDKLIREGYVLSHQEPIDTFFEIPIAGVKTKLGKLYFFHHRKYTTMDPPPEPQIKGGTDKTQIAAELSAISDEEHAKDA